ncbi:RimJ/RimL family protein N-acetyltransferase [Paenibacillus taihuensis]|uniref:RimJ/RimL family protein N-acetyltransferase n=1 Tax=Paenibacillus taihuensis TaxID=1156355 RepID=A0A3D9SBX3_9BACL|nr:GNAT family N-acetyltransferase [Paenibacillus taihuensis]REE91387.1 RimJ/RimL family protein N-acetyltransferase [Paenibacillus taihuensis]
MCRIRIECEDVYLREFEAADLEAFHSLTWQPEIYEYLPGWNVSLEQRTDWFMNYELPENAEFFQAVADGRDVGELRLRLAIILRETGELIGWCCSGIKDELPPQNREVMYAISRDHRGKGYTTQAARGMIGYLFAHTNVQVLNAVALLGNAASNRVIRKCGFEGVGKIEIDGEAYKYYRLEKRDWLGRSDE